MKQDFDITSITLNRSEKDLILQLNQYQKSISLAAEEYNPSIVANYVYELAKSFNKFYGESPVMNETDENLKSFRYNMCSFTGDVIENAMELLGIKVPERM